MKPLLTRTARPFLTYILAVLIVSIPIYYFVVDAIWKSELDDHNKIIAEKAAYALNQLDATDTTGFYKTIELWNTVQPGTDVRPVAATDKLQDSIFTIDKPLPHATNITIDRFRCLSTIIYLHNKPYRFTTETNIEESHKTIAIIFIITLLLSLLIIFGLYILNRRLSKKIWLPFSTTLAQLQKFNLSSQTKIDFPQTDIKEFNELHQSLQQLVEQNVSTYKSQKEFTENAAHELQTPLAILKNKLDLLLQDKDLTEQQYNIVEEMNRALTRSTRTNSNLLLLAKIDNNQFDNAGIIQFNKLLQQNIETLHEHFLLKNITTSTSITPGVEVTGNAGLTEILISNLLLNALRHTPANGTICIVLNPQGFEIANSGTSPLNETMLFKRFSRLSANNSGNGLGLAIVSQVCRVHHWKVSYQFKNDVHTFYLQFQ